MTGVVVTGWGTLNATGVGRSPLTGALRRGVAAVSEIDRGAGYHRADSVVRAALVERFGTADWIPPMKSRRMSTPSRYAVVAASEALRDASLVHRESPASRGGVAIGSSFGPAAFTEKLLDQIQTDGPQAASPAIFTECVASAAASQVAIHCKLTGANFTLGGRENVPLTAVARAGAEIESGRLDWALAGAVDEITPLLHSVLEGLRGLSPKPRPFDFRRNGLLAAEGATVWVLEDEARADDRGAKSLARLRAHASAFDASAGRAGWGRGNEKLAEALRRMLDESESPLSSIDLIVSGACGNRSGDRLEAEVLRRVWGEARLPPVTVPKRVTGEYGGAFLAAAMLALEEGVCAAAPEPFEVDPELAVEPIGADLPGPPSRLLVSTLASGGAASWILLERP